MSTDATKKKSWDNVIPMPDIYADEFAIDDTVIEEVVLESGHDDEPPGFDPYDTARLHKKPT